MNYRSHKSQIMSLSWQIQKRRHGSRSRSLLAAWAIFLNDDITVFHLVKKHSHDRYANKVEAANLSLFNQ